MASAIRISVQYIDVCRRRSRWCMVQKEWPDPHQELANHIICIGIDYNLDIWNIIRIILLCFVFFVFVRIKTVIIMSALLPQENKKNIFCPTKTTIAEIADILKIVFPLFCIIILSWKSCARSGCHVDTGPMNKSCRWFGELFGIFLAQTDRICMFLVYTFY